MQAMRLGCQAAIKALHRDNKLSANWTVETATDLLWAMLSIRTWELLTRQRGWTTEQYIERLQEQARRTFV